MSWKKSLQKQPKLENLSWLQKPWQALTYLYRTGIPHALLILGSEGLGKAHLLRAWEKLLLCQMPQNSNACGQCRPCRLCENETHPDCYHLGKEGKPIPIDDIRDILHVLSQKSHQSGRRLVTLWGINELPIGTAHALLKSVEEPPSDTFFVLVAQKEQGILATIESRCVRINVLPPSFSSALAWLADLTDYSEQEIQKCLRLAQNAPFKARQLLDLNVLALEKMLYSPSEKDFHEKTCQQFIMTHPKEALYFLYYQLVEKIRHSLVSQEAFVLLDDLIEGIKTLSVPGINKNMLFESLFFRCRNLQ